MTVSIEMDIKELLVKIEQKIDNLDPKIDQKIEHLDQKINQKIEHLDRKFEQKFDILNKELQDTKASQIRLEEKGIVIEKEIIDVKTRLNTFTIGFLGIIGVLVTGILAAIWNLILTNKI
ncbi:MAG: hypothetical protein DSM107014_06425 [Gomphosphaeria aponina SAG 52.96 = DSM 107014]|uniref:Uncharacterized protein n=1 Tax=Gomphosphaeria aponina SAG 52.96 = DSM 107014 TaxID=1521640 RepID=A0A941JSW8_9CHRO|nr:hypothetical protein [Gomphosphaeria aponina SAG 52.96 = DSM 107014]